MGITYQMPKRVTVSDLTARDGFQSETRVIPVEAKLFIINQLVSAGFKEMEVSALVRRLSPQGTRGERFLHRKQKHRHPDAA